MQGESAIGVATLHSSLAAGTRGIERIPMRRIQRAGTDFIVQRLAKTKECPGHLCTAQRNGHSDKVLEY